MSPEAVVLAMLVALPGATPTHSEDIANAIAEASNGDKLLAAELATIGFFESGYLPRIQAGECRKGECDQGRARTYWQLQRTSFSRDSWETMVGPEYEAIVIAAQTAGRVLLAGRKACRTVEGTLSWYACGRCSWSGARYRAKIVNRLMAAS